MSRNASGTYTLPSGNPVVTGTTISSAWANTTLSDLATEMTDSLDRSGKGAMLAALQLVDGALGTPALTWANENTGGWYRAAAADFRFATTGGDRIKVGDGTVFPTNTKFEITGSGIINDTNPSLYIWDSDGAVDAKLWRINGPANGLTISTRTDANGAGVSVLSLNRSGANLTSISFGNATNNPGYTFLGTGVGTFGGVVQAGDGTVGIPTFSFASDPDTGMYHLSANIAAMTAGGVLVSEFTSTPQLLQNPTNSAVTPEFSFVGDNNTGMFHIGADQLGFSINSAQVLGLAGTTCTIGLTTLNTGNAQAGPSIGLNGTVSNRDIHYQTSGSNRWSLRCSATAESGGNAGSDLIFVNRDDAGIALSTGPTFVRSSGIIQLTAALQLANGTVSLPSASFFNDTNNGLYYIGTDDWGLSAAGALVLEVLSGQAKYLTFEVGFREIPQNSQSVNYTLVLADNGKHIYHPSGGGAGDTYTIPANASVAYPIGTVLTFVNGDSNTVAIAITTDTMTLANTVTTGPRTLAQNGVATAIKTTATTWIISGTGLT